MRIQPAIRGTDCGRFDRCSGVSFGWKADLSNHSTAGCCNFGSDAMEITPFVIAFLTFTGWFWNPRAGAAIHSAAKAHRSRKYDHIRSPTCRRGLVGVAALNVCNWWKADTFDPGKIKIKRRAISII